MRIAPLFLAVICSALLSACGGGDSQSVYSSSASVSTSSSSSSVTSSSSSAPEFSLVLQEYEQGFCSYSGIVDTKHEGYTGVGFVDSINQAGEAIVWVVETTSAGNYSVSVRYANGASTPRSAVLHASEAETELHLDFPATSAWTDWQTEAGSIYLEAGTNTLSLVAQAADGLANIDSITLTGVGISAGECEEITDPDLNPDAGKNGVVGQPIGFATLNGGTTGGEAGPMVTVSDYETLKNYAESPDPFVILVEGTISNGPNGGRINVKSNKSIVGLGSTAFLYGVGINIHNNNNIILQNLRISMTGVTTRVDTPGVYTSAGGGQILINDGDAISISGSSKNIWIDHCELFSENPAIQTNINLYDGLIDIKHQTGFITISWNYLHNHHKGGLVGSSDSDLYSDRKITMHHNHYKDVKLRVPMYRGATGHFFNNYIVGARDATEIRAGTCVRVEKNYYEPLHYSIYTPSDSPGSTERIDNIEVSRTTRAYPSNCTADIPYDYLDVLTNNTQDVKVVVPQGAGVGKI